MVEPVQPYNPLDRVELGRSVERALLERPLGPLPPTKRFVGAGLYAIYYQGDLDLYGPITPLARPRGDVPIYVGRASPPGARQGRLGLEGSSTSTVLYHRLSEHARSIQQVEEHADNVGERNLRLSDFSCRYLVADDIWIPLAETLLIAHYRPVWNVVIDGFGNHAPGGGRKRQARSSWDELHPGRPWAADLPEPRKSASDLGLEVLDHFERFTGPNLEALPVVDEQVERALAEEADE